MIWYGEDFSCLRCVVVQCDMLSSLWDEEDDLR